MSIEGYNPNPEESSMEVVEEPKESQLTGWASPLDEKALPPEDKAFDTMHNPVVSVAENAEYRLLSWGDERNRTLSKHDIGRIRVLPSELIPPTAAEHVLDAKRLLLSKEDPEVRFTDSEVEKLLGQYEFDVHDYYEDRIVGQEELEQIEKSWVLSEEEYKEVQYYS